MGQKLWKFVLSTLSLYSTFCLTDYGSQPYHLGTHFLSRTIGSNTTYWGNLCWGLCSSSSDPACARAYTQARTPFIIWKEDKPVGITWKEYKSMTFTQNVIKEVLRARGGLGFLRRASQDIDIGGYTIPKGWLVFVFTTSVYLDQDTIKDPQAFNPWRWKDSVADDLRAKGFTPFGGGMRACSGADFSKVFMAVFPHVLVTKYRWTQVKGEGHGYYTKSQKSQNEGD